MKNVNTVKTCCTQNRELSWLRFNERVLDEANDETVPLLERLKFASIFTSNLDEFYMIRVGILFELAAEKKDWRDNKSKMTPREQLDAIFKETARLYKRKDKTFELLNKELAKNGVEFSYYKDCSKQEKKFLFGVFNNSVLPLLSPQIVDARHPTPNLQTKIPYIFVTLKGAKSNRIGIVPVPATLPEIMPTGEDSKRFVFTEDLILEFAPTIFSMYKISDRNIVCVTRNGDLTTDEESDGSEDFRNQMRTILKKRRLSSITRVEAVRPLSSDLEKFILQKLNADKKQIFITSAPLKMKFPYSFGEMLPRELVTKLSYHPFAPADSKMVSTNLPITKQVAAKDLLLFYPYEKMDPFLQLVKEAAEDPNTISIKITIYRLASRAKLVDYLCRAAENGVEVTTLIELRARFDEQNNIDWSERLEDAGCRVLYGLEGYKVHSKICLITKRVGGKIQHITQIGTGNYNEKTSKLYTDLSYITADPQIGKDAVEFFKNVSIGNQDGKYSKLLVAPTGLKSGILHLMDGEIAKGADGFILIKMNSLTDVDVINKLVEASKAGVQVELIIRGICCLLPGIEGLTENIHVRSIVGQFLEHSRIYIFGKKASRKYFIGSADMMTRNTECRVEILTPIKTPEIVKRLQHIVDVMMADNTKARMMLPTGKYIAVAGDGPRVCAQDVFIQEANS